MRRKLIIFISLYFFIGITSIYAQSDEVRFLIYTTISIMKNNAVNAHTVDWDTIRNIALVKAKDVNKPYKLGPAIRYQYNQIIKKLSGYFLIHDQALCL